MNVILMAEFSLALGTEVCVEVASGEAEEEPGEVGVGVALVLTVVILGLGGSGVERKISVCAPEMKEKKKSVQSVGRFGAKR
jgi:hypothetical protein